MRVSAELRGRRLALALLLLGLLPAVLFVAAFTYQRPDLPPGPPAYNPLALAKSPVLTALQARELQRSRRLSRESVALAEPRLFSPTFPDPKSTLVLAPRKEPYQLAGLAQDFPTAFDTLDDALLVRANIEVPRGAALVVDGAETPEVRLASSAEGFTTIIARGGTIEIAGTEDRLVVLSSWDERRQSRDTVTTDGRAFLLAFGGRMDLASADIGYLGFGTGTSSGVAWRGGPASESEADGPAAYGNVINSRLHHNWFGAYTYEALNMRWIGNTFANNEAYGFDPHDLSNDFLVEDNVAHGNGRHGFIFSRGCDRNVMRNNVAYDNRGHGFMIDDGRSEDTESAQSRRLPSNDNQIVGNHAYDNDGSGVEIEGGTGNVVTGNVLERNHVGVRIKNDASAAVTDNEITDSRLFGVDILESADTVAVAGNRVSGGWASISIADDGGAELTDNVLVGASTPLVVGGEAVRDESLSAMVGKYFKWNPLLVLWAAILGVPLLIGLSRLGAWFFHRRPTRISTP